jgi:hypothetical protein
MTRQVVQQSTWIVPIILLFVAACNKFNSPPTNRSGTTFVLFAIGVVFYYALIIALWLLVTIGLSQGSFGLAWALGTLQLGLGPEGREQLAQYAPIFSALIIVVASQFRWVSGIDSAARSFCINLAAIPREADRLALELSQSTEFQPEDGLRKRVTTIVSENISPKALNFSGDGSLSANFTRAVTLYWLFVGSRHNGGLGVKGNVHSRAVYARIMQQGEEMVARAGRRYEDLIQTGLAYFTSSNPAKELREALSENVTEVSNLVCNLIARFVLSCEMTYSGRRERLHKMGFDASHQVPHFGPDKWATTILGVIVLSIAIMAFMPGTKPPEAGKILIIAITFGISIGFAVLGAIVVAQRFIEHQHGEKSTFPPIAELVIAALIVASLSAALRIGIPLVPVLIQGGSVGLQGVVVDFIARWPGIIVPFFCTISLGLLCSYVGSLSSSWRRAAGIGALGNALAFAIAGLLVGWLLKDDVKEQFYIHPEHATRIIMATTSMVGAIIGAWVLAVFNKSERVRKDEAARAADQRSVGIPELFFSASSTNLEAGPVPSEAASILGGYTRSNVERIEGRYVCFRPAFTSISVITAYIIIVRWDESACCLVFEEQDRVDAGHTQQGRVYIPDGRPFMSLVTVERGAMRLIMVSRPDGKELARGLILTLSNPGGANFTPASAPIVLKRLVDETPQLGFIRSDSPDYEGYRHELEKVAPVFGLFAPAPALGPSTEVTPSKVADVRLSVVR